jgi:hypothetical protein
MNTSLYVSSVQFMSPGAPSYNYHLSSSSPAIDEAAGSQLTSDIDNQPRPFNSMPDIGADEYVEWPHSLFVPFVH